MPNAFTNSTFSTTYKDDFIDSDNYHRVLFNSGRALQARELIQLQTIIQEEVRRFADNIFKDGSVVKPGGLTLNTNAEFVKLEGTPDISTYQVGQTITEASSGVTARITNIAAYDGDAGDPATFYVVYTDTQGGSAGAAPVRFINGRTITNGAAPVAVQTANTTEDPSTGLGTLLSISTGDFYAQKHFVQCNVQTIIIDKYSNTPTTNIGFKVTEDIVTYEDNDALYDNQNVLPNETAPGADRYRITLTLSKEEDIGADENFIFLNRISNGVFVNEVDRSTYNIIGDEMATRTFEESGNYTVNPFTIQYLNTDDDTMLNLDVSPGTAYVKGYRTSKTSNTILDVNKAQTTETINNDVSPANFGNFVKIDGSTMKGFPNIDVLQTINLQNDSSYIGGAGSTIGTARVRHISRDAANYRYYLFDVQMNSGQNFRDVTSMGLDSQSWGNTILENGNAVIKEANNNNAFFDMSHDRPKSLTDISLTTQRRFTATTNTSTPPTATISLTAGGETFSNTTNWVVAMDSDGVIHTPQSITGSGTTAATLTFTNADSSQNIEILTFVNKSSAAVRSKTLTEDTITAAIESDGNGVAYIPLTYADIYNVTRVTAEDSDGNDVSNRFTLDNGQRDNFYGQGRMVLNNGFTAPTNDVFVRFTYFDHGGTGDFFAVNSYIGQVDYNDIPTYTQRNGEVIELRNVLDFRSRKGDKDSDFSVATGVIHELPSNTDLVTADVEYYLPRKDIVAVTAAGNIVNYTGSPSFNPVYPSLPEDAMDIYRVEMNAYTDDEDDMTINFVENKRYTMRDIGKIEKRIDNLEEVTTLNLLELETSTLEVLDSNGNNRFKNGFFADNFRDFTYTDETNAERRAAMDIELFQIRPEFDEKNVRLFFDSASSTNWALTGDVLTLSYADSAVISQTLASDTENINPYSIVLNEGIMELSPSFDEWRNVITLAWNQAAPNVSNNQRQLWNNWNWNWAGTDRTWINGRVQGARLTNRNNTRTSNVILIPFMRSRKVTFRARGLKPLTQHFAFFDGTAISAFVREETVFNRISRSSNVLDQPRWRNAGAHPNTATSLVTDVNGEIVGSFFIPSNTFRTGSREFKLLDISADNEALATSTATSTYTSVGITTFRRIPRPQQIPARRDPLAQSFQLPSDTGGFITKIDLYFSTRPSASIPVLMELRPVENGVPSQSTILGTAIVERDDVQIPGDTEDLVAVQSLPTSFVFEEPIFIDGNTEYAFVITADTTDYNVYVAEAGAFQLGTTAARINRQPTLGSLFLSQNSLTWTPDQKRDMMFKLYRASFNINDASNIVLENIDMAEELLDTDPFLTDSGSSTIYVNSPNHGLMINDVIDVAGIDSADDVGGISGASIVGENTVTKVDGFGFTFEADSAATATIRAGGSTIRHTQNAQFDTMFPFIETFVPDESTINFTGKFTSGVSMSNANNVANNAYGKETSSTAFVTLENFDFDAPRMVAGSKLEEAELGVDVRSATITATMSSTNDYISPSIDLSRASLFLMSNRIDNQDSDASSVDPLNNPVTWVAETDPTSGTTLAKHVTRPINIEEPAVGLKVLLGANRPDKSFIDVYYRTIPAGDDTNIIDLPWTYTDVELTTPPTDNNPDVFRQYEYLIGGQGGNLTPFTTFQLKIVFRSSNSSAIPRVRDLRAIALGT